jgi:hypothetical protein
MAYSPEVDETHWASVKQQWVVWQHDAQCRAQACKTERLPEPLLREVLTKLHSLDRLWEIACDYRIKAADAKSQIAEASRRKYRQWHRPQVEKGVQRVANHVQGTGCTLDDAFFCSFFLSGHASRSKWLYLPQEKRIDGTKFSSRWRPPITAAPHAAAAPAANAAAKVNARITAL